MYLEADIARSNDISVFSFAPSFYGVSKGVVVVPGEQGDCEDGKSVRVKWENLLRGGRPVG